MASLLDELAAGLATEPERLRQALRRSAAEGKNAWTDSGGLRVAWRHGSVVIESYVRIDGVTPADLLALEDDNER